MKNEDKINCASEMSLKLKKNLLISVIKIANRMNHKCNNVSNKKQSHIENLLVRKSSKNKKNK